jgi:hypothetical protein
VTAWSRYDNRWRGVLVSDLLALVRPTPDARFVLLQSYDTYTTNLPLAEVARRAAGDALGGQAADPRAQRPAARGGAAALFLEKRQVGASPSPRKTGPASGKCAAITTTAIRGRKSGIATEAFSAEVEAVRRRKCDQPKPPSRHVLVMAKRKSASHHL